jgi:hypothetical protein
MSVFYPILTVIVRKIPNSRPDTLTRSQAPTPFLPGIGRVVAPGYRDPLGPPHGRGVEYINRVNPTARCFFVPDAACRGVLPLATELARRR